MVGLLLAVSFSYKSARDPVFSFLATQMLPHSMPKEGIGSLRVNEGFQELEKLDASMLSPLVSFFIFEDK